MKEIPMTFKSLELKHLSIHFIVCIGTLKERMERKKKKVKTLTGRVRI